MKVASPKARGQDANSQSLGPDGINAGTRVTGQQVAPDTDPTNIKTSKPPRVLTTMPKEAFWRRRNLLYNERSSWVETWRFLSDYFQPRRGRWFITQNNRGERRDQKIMNGTTLFAVRDLAAGMMSGITSPVRPWFRIAAADRDLNKRADVKSWNWEVSERMLELFGRSNLYNILPSCYAELGVFGTMAMYEMEDLTSVVRFVQTTANAYMIAQNQRGEVDTIYRDLRMTVRQLVQMFGFENCSTRTQTMWRSGNIEQWIEMSHAIEPNNDRNPYMQDARNMSFRSLWFEWGDQVQQFLRISGFNEFPAFAVRWETSPEDVYGTGPGHHALGDAKQLMYQEKQKAMAIDKHVNPPMVASPALKKQRASLLPGDVTYVDGQNGMTGFQPAYAIKPDPNLLLKNIEELEERIRTAFYTDLFLMMAEDQRSGVTAREIEEKHEEKLLMLGPVLQRVNDELLTPMIRRTFNIMMRRGLIPPPPTSMRGQKLNIEYISILAQAQKLVGTATDDAFLNYVANASAAKQAGDQSGIGDMVDWDKMTAEYADKLGVKPDIILGEQKVQAKRQQRAQQQQMAQMAAMAKPAADAAGALKDAGDAEPPNAALLSTMLGGGNSGLPGAR